MRWLLSHEAEAKAIGRRGAALAEALTYEAEMDGAVAAIDDAVLRAIPIVGFSE